MKPSTEMEPKVTSPNRLDRERLRLQLERMRIENQQLEKQWQTCCSGTNREFLKYIVQVILGVATMVFCAVMIATSNDGEDKSFYVSLLSATFGLFLPHPSPGMSAGEKLVINRSSYPSSPSSPPPPSPEYYPKRSLRRQNNTNHTVQ